MSMRISVYLCEDDTALAGELKQLLIDEGFLCEVAHSGSELDGLLAMKKPDILLLDLQLGAETGLDLANRYRQSMPTVPIVFLSAHGSEQNRIATYEAGAVLFLAKPFAPAELIAVLRSITSRMDLAVKIKLDQVAKRLIGSYRTRHLSEKEYTLLCNLALNYPELTPYEDLIDALSIDPSKDSRSYLEVIVSRLRSKLLRLHEPPLKVLNKTRQGYVLNQAIELD